MSYANKRGHARAFDSGIAGAEFITKLAYITHANLGPAFLSSPADDIFLEKCNKRFYFQKKGAPLSDVDLSDDGWARRLYAEALRCREQDGEDEALEELRSLAAGMARAAASKELWRL